MMAASVGPRIARRLAVLAVAGLVAFGAPVAGQATTLADAMAGAYKTSGLLEQNRALLRAADEQVAITLAALRPVINWTSQLRRQFGDTRTDQTAGNIVGFANNSASIGISAQLLLYDFGSSRLATESAKESVLAAREGLISIEQQVLLRAVRAYMNVRRESENVSLRQNNVRLINQELRAARDRFEVGEVTRTDVAQAESRLASARSSLAAAQGNLDTAREEYRAVVGTAPGNLQAPRAIPNLPASVDKARQIAVRGHPDILQSQRQVAAADLNVERARAAMKPTVTLNGGLNLNTAPGTDNITRSGEVSLSAGGPIYQGGRLSALLRQQMAQRDAQRGALHVTAEKVAQNVGNAWALMRVARASLTASNEQIRAADVAFRGVREEATLGARTTLDVLNAEQDLLNAKATRIGAITDEYISAYSLLAAMGLLTTERLKLNVQRYDPAAYYNMVKGAPTNRSRQGQKLDRVLKALGK